MKTMMMKKQTTLMLAALLPLGVGACAPGAAGDESSDTTARGALCACSGDWTVVDSPNVGGQYNALAAASSGSAILPCRGP